MYVGNISQPLSVTLSVVFASCLGVRGGEGRGRCSSSEPGRRDEDPWGTWRAWFLAGLGFGSWGVFSLHLVSDYEVI